MNDNGVRGFKVFNHDWTCRGFQYEVGKIYEEDVKPTVCGRGFHFCKRPQDCFNYYPFNPNNKVAEVLALGEVAEEGDKCCTNKIKIVREISWEEVLTLVNMGRGNSGFCNTGNRNAGNRNTGNKNNGHKNTGHRNVGNRNTGDGNTGHRNTGNWNTGNWNTGDCNAGDWNTGHWNTGHRNTGKWNAGNRNTGDCNTGNRNTGDYNTGDWNTGHWNTGNFCTGDFNISDHATGCFNTQNQKLKFFDKESDMAFKQWRNSEAYHLLRRVQFEPNNTDCFKKWWNELTEREKEIIKNIPNFDAKKFELITGIKVE